MNEIICSVAVFLYLCRQTLWTKKRRYAYLVSREPRKFKTNAQRWHSGSHAIWRGLLSLHLCIWVFLGPSIRNVGFACSRFLIER